MVLNYLIFIIYTDATFSPQNLKEVVTPKEIDKWEFLGYLIGDRNSQDGFEGFRHNLDSEETKTYQMLKEWQRMHPYASWTVLYEALTKMNKTDISQLILEKYLSGLLYLHFRLWCILAIQYQVDFAILKWKL